MGRPAKSPASEADDSLNNSQNVTELRELRLDGSAMPRSSITPRKGP